MLNNNLSTQLLASFDRLEKLGYTDAEPAGDLCDDV
jgi:hypothetical protein